MSTGMDWFLWLTVAWWAVNGIGSVALIGRHREPISPGAGAILVAIYAAMIIGLLVTR